MKKGLIVLLILLTGLSACGCGTNQSIVGNWSSRDETGNYKILTFFDDGSFQFMWGYKYKADSQIGTYGNHGNTIQIAKQGASSGSTGLFKSAYSIDDFSPVKLRLVYHYQIIGDALYLTGISAKKPNIHLNGIYYRD